MTRAAQRYPQMNQVHGDRLVEGLTRDEICLAYRDKVLLLARRVAERLPPGASLDLDDLVSLGAIGLLEAFARFDASREIQFSTFAEYRIRGAMLDALRETDTSTRRRRQMAKRIDYAQESLSRRLGRDPDPGEVADFMGMELDKFHKAQQRTQPVRIMSLDAPVDPGNEDSLSLADQLPSDDPSAMSTISVAEVKVLLKEAISKLPERQRQCVLLYYGKDLTLAEIAKVYGVTVSRISQILSDARRRLRKQLAEHVDLSLLDNGWQS